MYREIARDSYAIEVRGCNVLGTPVGGTELGVVMGVAGVPNVGKMEKDLAIGCNRIPFAMARRSKSLQLLR